MDNGTAPLQPTTVGSVLRAAAESVPGGLALVEGTPIAAERRRWRFEELLQDAEAIAGALLERFVPGEHVALWAPNSADWVLTELGMALAGLTLVTVNPAFRGGELRHVLRQSGAAGIVLARHFRGSDLPAVLGQVQMDLPRLREVLLLDEIGDMVHRGHAPTALPVVEPHSAAQLQFTSGTTGVPKGALLTHFGITNNSRLLSERLEVAPGSVWLNQMPMFHTGGCVLSTLGPIQRRTTQVLLPAFDPAVVLDIIETERVNVTGGVPTMLLAMLDHPRFEGTDVSSMTAISSGGAVVPPELVTRIEQAFGVRYATMFGQTEAAPGITMTCLGDSAVDKAATVGTALPWNEIRIVDPVTLTERRVGEVGELLVRSPMLMAGYYDWPEATGAAFAGGWLRTGDLCSVDDRGYYRVAGRVKDMITRGGENIYPAEIEEVLRAHPGVRDAYVVGLPDEHWGEVVAAAVVAAGARPTDEELGAWVRGQLASYKVPRAWKWIDEPPMNDGGKVQKFRLRDDW